MAKDYIETLNPKGYRSQGEVTNLPGLFLVAGSHDCAIVNGEKVASRKGYTLVGDGKTKNNGIKDGIDWETNRAFTRSVRLNTAGELEVWFVNAAGTGSWALLKLFSANTRAQFTPWWDATALVDKLLVVAGDANVYSWTGGVAEIATTTATTVSLKGYTSGSTIAFVEGGASNDTITDSANSFVTAGFQAGDTIEVSGTSNNDGSYTILTVTAGVITLYPDDDLTNESAGSAFVIQRPTATWAQQGFSATGSVRINNIEYTYTGGTATGTLTGLTGVSGVTAGDIAMQILVTNTPSGLAGLTLDLVATYNNYVFYGDKTNKLVYMSKSNDFTDVSYTKPLRLPTEGADFSLDSTPTAFVPDGGPGEFHIHGRKNDIYSITFELSADLSGENVVIKKLPTATGQAAVNQGAVVRIKNAIAFMSFEQVIDTVGRILAIDTPTSKPISYNIKDDLSSYDVTDANGLFYQNQILMALPKEGKVIIYDTEQQIWQPPHNLPIGKLALIDIDNSGTQVLCGHSSIGNETYRLYDGYNDNGAPIAIEMRFGYENYGTRFGEKSFDELATELYASSNTNVTSRILYDYLGSTDIREFVIHGDGSDQETSFTPATSGGLGVDPLGLNPLGSLTTEVEDLNKIRVVDTTPLQEFFERQRIFTASGIDIRFAVLAFGENVQSSDNVAIELKR